MPTPHPNAWPVAKVRQTFIDFFQSKPAPANGHSFVPSSPCVPVDDPTLLFTNAGMNQFKPLFLGRAEPSSPLFGLKRAVNSQKCIRAGGKHNDLEDVGKDTYHHTFFEMLGNWSFGDYFKAEAVEWSWELLTQIYHIPPEALYATYFEGNPETGLEPDLETKALWEKFLPPERVLPGSMKDNFWEMGETGPCGPCTEIHVDRLTAMGEPRKVPHLVNAGDPDVIEIWNNVFIQFNREPAPPGQIGVLKPLPAKHVDTGMGLERLASVLQHKRSNYDTDVFLPIFAKIEELTKGRHTYRGKLGEADKGHVDTAFRVIADHIRTLTFAITDGAVPSNEGRGYVLRRIIRRAVRYGRQNLGLDTGFFSMLVPTVVEHFGNFFPELKKNPQRVMNILRDEEESFGKTLDRGLKLFNTAIVRAVNTAVVKHNVVNNSTLQLDIRQGTKLLFGTVDGLPQSDSLMLDDHDMVQLSDLAKKSKLGLELPIRMLRREWLAQYVAEVPTIAPDDAFKLHDTYGFPIDLTRLMAEERGLSVDTEGFDRLMEEAKEKARTGSGGKFSASATAMTLQPDTIAKLGAMHIPKTDDLDKFHAHPIAAHVRAIWDGHNFVDRIRPDAAKLAPIALILDKTNFYAEMGGQEADHGRITVLPQGSARGAGGELRVDDVRSFAGYVLHIGMIARGELAVGDNVQLTLDTNRRTAITANHTATHLLNHALRAVLAGEGNEGVDQKGSLVAPDRLRFDFTAPRPVTPEELAKVEDRIQHAIKADMKVYTQVAPLFLAKNINGLRAVFGEAYPDPVRVVSVGAPLSHVLEDTKNAQWFHHAIEFCGGTHVESTGQIQSFALVSEEAVAKGVRRIVALTGPAAHAALQAGEVLKARVATAANLEGQALATEAQAIATDLDTQTLSASTKSELRAKLAALQEKIKAAQKQAGAARASQAAARARTIAADAQSRGDTIIVTTLEAAGDRAALQSAVNTVTQTCPSAAVMLLDVDAEGGKVAMIAAVPKPLIDKGLKAGDWVRAASEVVGGKGGGRPESAQGGGTDTTKVKEALQTAVAFAHSKIG